ncbi:hypothetical protein MASR1M60_30500 [Rhodocyclaceae bacterium]
MRNPKKSDGVLRERCAGKYAWIDGQRKAYPLPAMYATAAIKPGNGVARRTGNG